MTLSAAATANAAISSVGIGSGLDVTSIINKLMSVEQQPLNLLTQQEASYNAKISAYGTLQSAVSQFQTAMSGLTDPTQYESLSATSSNAGSVTATVGTSAVAGNYALGITNLAQAQNLVSTGQASTTGAIGSGTNTTLNFNFGTISGGTLTSGVYTGASFTPNGNGIQSVTINSSNNSLSGIANAINSANIGVSASIINDGNATNPYVLSLTSTKTGAANSMQISVSGDATLSSMLSENPAGTQALTQYTASQNANFTVNGLGITSASNTITSAIQGVSLNLLGATPVGSPATISVASNPTAVTTAVNNFVSAYNTLAGTLQTDSAYNPTTHTGAIFNGETPVVTMQHQLQNLLSNPVPGGAGNALTMLSQAGVTLQNDGTLSVNNTQLQAAITANPTGFAGLFAVSGQTSDNLINYAGISTSTHPGVYPISINQLATQGTAVGGALPSSTTITAGGNDTLQVQLDGNSSNITLVPGSYTPATLATQIQSQINGNSTFSASGSSVTVTANPTTGALQIMSNRYGSASKINITGGDGQSSLNFSSAVTTTGLDVAGTINSVTAVGSGQTLTGAAGNASSGLAVQVNGGAFGVRGTVSYSQGYAYQFNELATSILSPTGAIATATSSYNTMLQQNATQQTTLNTQLAVTKARYMAQFTALDTLISSMNATSTFLTQQLSSTTAST